MTESEIFSTGGGKVWWENAAEYNGWRVQKHHITQHFRVLNPENIRIAWGIEKDIVKAFEDMINRHQQDSERFVNQISNDYRLNDTACLLIHGYAGDLSEIKYLKKYLEYKNLFDVYDIVLAGHGGTKRELEKTDNHDWMHSAEEKIKELQLIYSKIIIIGFSMGGLIGSQIAAKADIYKLILVNTPFDFWNILVILKDIFSFNVNHINHYIHASARSSMKSNFDFLSILKDTKNMFQDVKCPTLIIQCTGGD